MVRAEHALNSQDTRERSLILPFNQKTRKGGRGINEPRLCMELIQPDFVIMPKH